MSHTLSELDRLTRDLPGTRKMPVLFLGHGSPMNGIEDNEFVRGFKKQGSQLSKPRAVLVVSAHWETPGTRVTAMANPRTIHDFGGFPPELYQVEYPAPGHPELALQISESVRPVGTVRPDHIWGLDHGSWTVVRHLFPEADVPVLQLSLDVNLSPHQHYDLARQLKGLRQKGVLIIGSGNMVHNLRRVAFDRIREPYAYDWALEAGDAMKQWILSGDHRALINFGEQGRAFELAIPTAEHYLPLIYSLALKDPDEEIALFNDQTIGGSLSMTSVRIG